VRDAALGRLLSGQSKGLWGTYSGSWATNDGDGNAATLTRNASSFVLGLDASPVKGLTVGVLGGYAKSDARLPARSSTAKIDSYTVGAYAGADAGRVKLRFGGAYSWQNVDTNRSVAFAGFSDKLSAHYSASTAQAFGDIGYTIGSDRLNVEPFAQAAWMDVATDAFTETGGAAALTASKQSRELGVVTLGLRGVAGFSIAGAAARFHATAGWRQATGDRTPDASLSFASGSAAFDIAGAPIAKDSAMIDAGIDVAVTPRLRLNVGYTGQLASHTRDNGVKTGLSMAF
jgi:outer membrane autotransporter protein